MVAAPEESKLLLTSMLQQATSAFKVSEIKGKIEAFPKCRIPDDCIDSKRYPLFMARDVMRVLIEQLQAEGATPS